MKIEDVDEDVDDSDVLFRVRKEELAASGLAGGGYGEKSVIEASEPSRPRRGGIEWKIPS